MYNSPSIETILPVQHSHLYNAFEAIGVVDPNFEQIKALAQHLRDVANNAAVEGLEQWKKERETTMPPTEAQLRDLLQRAAYLIADLSNPVTDDNMLLVAKGEALQDEIEAILQQGNRNDAS